MLAQKRNIAQALAQRGDAHIHDIEPVIQVIPEFLLRDHGLQIPVGGRDHAHIHMPRIGCAKRRKFLVLQHAQKLALQVDGHVTDLVQENGPPVGQLKFPLAVLRSAGERAALISEKFKFEQIFRDCRAVYHNEALVPALARIVDGFCNKLLARAAFARDEHICIHILEPVDQPVHALHGFAFTDDLVVMPLAAQRVRKVKHLFVEFAEFHRLRNENEQFIDVKRFDEVGKRTVLHRLHRGADASISSHHDHGDVRIVRLKLFEHIQPIFAADF